jgi:hypothetical protein
MSVGCEPCARWSNDPGGALDNTSVCRGRREASSRGEKLPCVRVRWSRAAGSRVERPTTLTRRVSRRDERVLGLRQARRTAVQEATRPPQGGFESSKGASDGDASGGPNRPRGPAILVRSREVASSDGTARAVSNVEASRRQLRATGGVRSRDDHGRALSTEGCRGFGSRA